MLITVGTCGFLLFQAIGRFPERLGPLVAPTAMQTIVGPVSRIRDGDTIEVNGLGSGLDPWTALNETRKKGSRPQHGCSGWSLVKP
jgi:hypothetical protein